MSFWKSIQVWSRTCLLNHLKEIRKVEIHPARCIVVWAVAQHRVMRGPARQKGTISSFLFLLHQMWHIVRFPRWEERATTTKDREKTKKKTDVKTFYYFFLRDLTGSNLFNASVIKSRDVLRKEIIIITSPSFRDHGFFKKVESLFFHISQNWLNVLILTVFFFFSPCLIYFHTVASTWSKKRRSPHTCQVYSTFSYYHFWMMSSTLVCESHWISSFFSSFVWSVWLFFLFDGEIPGVKNAVSWKKQQI